MVNIVECPVCNSKVFESVLLCKDHSITQEEFQLIRCTNCQFLITSPRPEQEELKRYYFSEKYISHSDTAQGVINKLYHLVRKITLRNKISLIQKYYKQPELLDIGSGAGYFLSSCKQYGFQAKGIEPDSSARIRSINQFNIDVFDEDELNKMSASRFDVITLWHVLEHVEDINIRIKQINRLLKQEGILIIALPNCSSNDAKYYQTYWAGYDVPRHLWHFTPETIQRFMKKFDFEILQTLPMYYDAYYVSMLSEKYKNSKFGIARGILRGALSNLMAAWNQKNTYSSQIYLFRKKV